MKKNMKEMMEELTSSGKPKELSKEMIQAKKEMLMELLGVSEEALKKRVKDGLDGARAMKVSVMAKDKEGLKEGLEKAEEVLEGEMPEMEEESEEQEESEESLIKADSSMLDEVEEKEEEKKPEMDEEDEEESFFMKKRK